MTSEGKLTVVYLPVSGMPKGSTLSRVNESNFKVMPLLLNVVLYLWMNVKLETTNSMTSGWHLRYV